MPPNDLTLRRRAAVPRPRFWLALFLVAGWFVKAMYFWRWFSVDLAVPMSHLLFPEWASSASVAVAAYAVGGVGFAAAAVIRSTRTAAVSAMIGVGGASTLLVHLGAYNDATFVTAWWAGLWLVWFCLTEQPERTRYGPRLAQAVISLTFFGGALGKLTAEYAQGSVFYSIYFAQKSYLPYVWLRTHASATTVYDIARAFSWMVIFGELLVAAAVLVPRRNLPSALLLSIAVAVTMVLISGPWLSSVMAPVAGVAVAGLLVLRTPGTLAPGSPGGATR